MRKLAPLAVSVLLAAAAFWAGTRYPRNGGGAAAAGSKVLHWLCPMHPGYRSDKPGIAPCCGMQLEPVYADGTMGEAGAPRPAGAAKVSVAQQQLLGVRVGTVEKAPFTHSARLLGRVVLDERRVFVLNAALEGSVREVSSLTTGSRVRKGDWLASVFSVDARASLQAFITALDVVDRDPAARREEGIAFARGTTARSSTDFTTERLRAIGVADRQIEEMRRTRQVPVTIEVRAPADGFVLARNVSAGQKFERGAEWYRIGDLDRVWILADVSADEAPHLRPGTVARVRLPGGQRSVEAKVSEALPQFDPATRTLKVRLEAENPGHVLRPDMLVDLELPLELPPATTIPLEAIVDSGTRKTVFFERADGWFEPRAIETGWSFGERVEVVKGLAAGDRIVVSGTFLVDSESRLRAAAAGVHGAVARDPVCGMDVDEAKAKAAGKVHEHGGKTYFFCAESCRDRFRGAPATYLAEAAAPEASVTTMPADAKR
jgi:Cu(I)/Ag(I) efflux system membrane fusion protein